MIIGEEEIPNERALLTQEDGPMMASSASVKYIVIHCSATRSTRDYTAEQLLRDHKTRGFRTVGYHFYIRRDGSVTQHRKLLEVGAHCRPWNRCSIGICYEGGLDADGRPADTRTPEQTEQFILLLMRMVKIFPGVRIRGHRDMPGSIPKACPCFDAEGVFGYLENNKRKWQSPCSFFFGGNCMENALTYDLFFFVERFYNNEFTQSTDYHTNRIR